MLIAIGKYLSVEVTEVYQADNRAGGKVVSCGEDVSIAVDDGDTVYFSLDSYNNLEVGDSVSVHENNISEAKYLEEFDPIRRAIYKEIEAQRKQQDEELSAVSNCEKVVRMFSQDSGSNSSSNFRNNMLKTAALSIAAIEMYDRLACQKS